MVKEIRELSPEDTEEPEYINSRPQIHFEVASRYGITDIDALNWYNSGEHSEDEPPERLITTEELQIGEAGTILKLTSDETGVHFSGPRNRDVDDYGREDYGDYGGEESDNSNYTLDGGGNRGKFSSVLVILWHGAKRFQIIL